MKKVMTFIMTLVLVVSVAGCGSSESKYEDDGVFDAKEKYEYEHIGIYDTKTQQYIDIGDNMEKIDEVLGTGKESNVKSFREYSDGLSVCYDDLFSAENLFIHTHGSEDAERYKLVDGFGYSDTVTEFINKYPYVYSCDETKSGVPEKNVCIILQKTDEGTYILSKDELMKMEEKDDFEGDIYRIQVDYYSYDSLSYMMVAEENYPSVMQWDKYLVDIEK